jgi:hypothetical protein
MPLPQVSDRIKELPGQALRAVFAGVGQLLLAADKVRAQLAAPPDAPAAPAAPAEPPAVPAPPATSAPPAPQAEASPAAGSSRPAPQASDPADSRWRSLDKTGNVRLLPDGDEDASGAASTPPAAAAAGAEPAVAAEPAPAEPAEPAAAEVAEPAPADRAVPTPTVPAVPAAEVAEPAPAEPAAAEPAAAEPAAAVPAAALPVAGYDQLSVASLRARLRVLDVAQVQTLLAYEKANQSRADMITMFERRIVKLEQGG